MNILTIHDQWLDYKEKVLPKDASDIQIHECQLAFYAGVITAFVVAAETSEVSVYNEVMHFYEGIKDRIKTRSVN